jgi:hypothetical protein
MRKYKPLSERLAGHPGDEWRASFAEIEEVLGFPLPKAARAHAWWASPDDRPHARAWTSGGWRAEMDQASGAVTFRRSVSEPALQGAPEPVASPLPAASDEIQPLAMKVASEEASIRSRLKGWGITAAIAAGAAAVAGVGALVLRERMRRRNVGPER